MASRKKRDADNPEWTRGDFAKAKAPEDVLRLTRTRSARVSVAPRDVDGSLFAVTSGNRHGFRAAAWHIGPVGRSDSRRKAMRPIPGNVIGVGVVDVAG